LHLRLILALVLVLLVPLPYSVAQDASRDPGTEADLVTVPNFWDPRARLERPSNEEIGGAIRFLTVDDFPPFAFRDRRGLLIGFNIDLAQAICSVLKVQCAIQTRPFETLLAGLNDGTGNAILAGLDAERARTEGLIATQTYLKIPARFATRKDTTFDPSVGTEGYVGTTCNSAQQAYLVRFFPDLTVVCYMDPAVPLAELKAGRLEAVFGDSLSIAFWLHGPDSEDCCRFTGGAYVDDRYFGTGLTIVVKADNRPLKFALDYALREIYRAGTYEELYLRYFPVSLF